MASKFSEFLQSQKIDPRRVVAASRQLERLRAEDRAKRLKQRQAKASEASKEGQPAAEKPRSGRPVTAPMLAKALEGKALPAPGKTRLLRAVNHVLVQKKKDAVDLRALF